MRSRVSPDWLASYIKGTRPVLEIFKMSRYSPASPRNAPAKREFFLRQRLNRYSSISVVTMRAAGRLGESELDSKREQIFSVHHTSPTAPGEHLALYPVGVWYWTVIKRAGAWLWTPVLPQFVMLCLHFVLNIHGVLLIRQTDGFIVYRLHTYVHTYIHTNIHTYIHTYIYTLAIRAEELLSSDVNTWRRRFIKIRMPISLSFWNIPYCTYHTHWH